MHVRVPVLNRVETWEAGMFKVRRILDHRAVRGGQIEYEVQWHDKKKDGTSHCVARRLCLFASHSAILRCLLHCNAALS